MAAVVIRDAAIAAGAPEDCIQWLDLKSMYATTALMKQVVVYLKIKQLKTYLLVNM